MPSAPLCPGRLTQYQKKAFSPLRPLITPQVTVHKHHDLDILKYHRHFPLSQSPLNLYTALKKFPLQKTRLLTERESEKKMPNHAWLPSARTKPPLWKCANFIAIYGWTVANSPGYGTGRSKGRFSGERSGAVRLFLFIFTDDSF